MTKFFTSSSLKKTLIKIANDKETSENLLLYSFATFAKKTHANSVNYYNDNVLYFLDSGKLVLNSCVNSINIKIDEADVVLIMNIYGHMIKKHKYSSNYRSINKNMGTFCKKLANLLNDHEIPKSNIVEMEQHICKIIDRILSAARKV
jgi:hypothetical protein